MKTAADQFLHISSDYWHEHMVGLAERLARHAPMKPAMSFLCQSGTEAVEGALKLARYVTGRSRFIGFLGGFHGRTMGSLSFTSSKYTQQKGFLSGHAGRDPCTVSRIHTGRCWPAPTRARRCWITSVCCSNAMCRPRKWPAILVEPIQGEGGYLIPPDSFLPGLRALCDEHGILLICDEVQSGVGRTGKMFACEHWGVEPDIICSAKGLGSGLPIGAVIAKKSIDEPMAARCARQHLRRQSDHLRGRQRHLGSGRCPIPR